ncbi:hypothetical protein KFU94_56915 [Chloroflexi bacterium TSY]|nr:hypothetical protein [Chloroflexi bacterium TSY]
MTTLNGVADESDSFIPPPLNVYVSGQNTVISSTRHSSMEAGQVPLRDVLHSPALLSDLSLLAHVWGTDCVQGFQDFTRGLGE